MHLPQLSNAPHLLRRIAQLPCATRVESKSVLRTEVATEQQSSETSVELSKERSPLNPDDLLAKSFEIPVASKSAHEVIANT